MFLGVTLSRETAAGGGNWTTPESESEESFPEFDEETSSCKTRDLDLLIPSDTDASIRNPDAEECER